MPLPFDYSRALKDLNYAKRGSPIDFDRFCEIIYGTKPIKDSELDNILAKLKDPKLFAQAFALFDLDNSGRVDPQEIKATLDAVARALANRNNENAKGTSGPKPLAWNYKEVDARLRHAGRGTDMNKVQFKELLHPSEITDSILHDKMNELELCLSNIKKAKRAFELVDLDKSGSIDNFEMRVCLKTLAGMAAKKMSNIKKIGIPNGIKPLSFPNKRIQENLAKKMLDGPLDFSEFTYTIYVEPYETEQDRKDSANGKRELLPKEKHILEQQKAARDTAKSLSDPAQSKTAFEMFDLDGNKFLDHKEFHSAIEAMHDDLNKCKPSTVGPEPMPLSKYQMDLIYYNGLDDSEYGDPRGINYPLFCKLLYNDTSQTPPNPLSESTQSTLQKLTNFPCAREAFGIFDTDSSGSLDLGEFSALISEIAKSAIKNPITRGSGPTKLPFNLRRLNSLIDTRKGLEDPNIYFKEFCVLFYDKLPDGSKCSYDD